MTMLRVLIICVFTFAGLPGWAQSEDSSGPMQRKATEASADRLLDDSLLSDKERRARAQAKLAEPPPDTSDRDTLAEFHFARGMAFTTLGRQSDALRDLRKAATLVAANGYFRAEVFYNLSQTEMNLGKVSPAIASLREASRNTSQNNTLLRNLALITEQYAKLGNAEGALATRKECEAMSGKAALDMSDRNATARTWRETNMLRCDIAVAVAQGKLAEAEPLIRRVIAVYESAPNTRGTYTVGNRHQQLAENLRQQGRLAEAENESRIALSIYQSSLGAMSQRTGNSLIALGRIIAEQGRLKEGETLARKGLEVIQEAGVKGKGGGRAQFAEILVAQYRWQEARQQFALVKEGYEEDPEGWEAFTRLNPSYALSLLKSGGAAEALPLLTRAFDDFRVRLGEDNYITAQARGLRAAALAALGRSDEALGEFAKAAPVLIGGSGEEDEETGNLARDQKLRLILESHMDQLLKARGSPAAAGLDPVAESFRLADAARGRSVQRALAASAVRAAAGNPAIADLARRAQDADKQISALNGLLANAISARAEDQDAAALTALKARIAGLRDSRAAALTQIAAKFPEYGRMLNPQPSTVKDVQSRLKPGEAMIAFYSADDRTYAWAVPAAGEPAVAVSSLGREALDAAIRHLRQALDLSVNGVEEIPDFDLAAAHALYAGLMQPTEAAWGPAGLLFLVPHGPLGQLPAALLPTRPPAKTAAKPPGTPLFTRYREVDWLARKVAIAQLPSVGALATLRALPDRHPPRRDFLAFGDPLFSKEQAQEAAAETTALASRGFKRRNAPKSGPDYSADLAQLPRLPDTAAEVRSIAEVLKADPEQDLFLEARASQANLDRLDLSKWRIVMFATHGLIPGDLAGLDQPALALTSPEVTGDGSSGLLTMEHIMGLKLDADWVVLSACNTAAGEGAGAEAVSGLGRAFFYAGARALLVSNWPVETTSARMLTTDLFRRQAEEPGLVRAKAMQAAMLTLMDGPGARDGAGREQFVYAHPTFWAPFSLVGDGGN